jgi:hypothetical protein
VTSVSMSDEEEACNYTRDSRFSRSGTSDRRGPGCFFGSPSSELTAESLIGALGQGPEGRLTRTRNQ